LFITTTLEQIMARHNPNATTMTEILEYLTENGFDGMAHAVEILLNEAMKLERSEFLNAGHYERSEDRLGYANGFKAKRVKTRIGEFELEIPKVRGT
jgi:putative transposase